MKPMSSVISSLNFSVPKINWDKSKEVIDPVVEYTASDKGKHITFEYSILEDNSCVKINDPIKTIFIHSFNSNFHKILELVENNGGTKKELTLQISVVGNDHIKASTKLICS